MANIIRNDAIGLLQAADELELIILLDYIQDELIKKHVDWINNHLVKLLHICALLQSCKKLIEYCQNEISCSLGLIFESADFNSLEHNVLKSLLQHGKLNVDEIKIWNKIITWGKAQLQTSIATFKVGQSKIMPS